MTSTNPGGQSGPASPAPAPPPLTSRRSRQGISLVTVMAAFALSIYLLNGGVATSQNSGGTPVASPIASPQADDPRITIEFTELNDSGVSGSATLFAAGDTTIVEFELDGTGEDHPAHIHAGTCEDIQPEPEFNLQNVGESGTGTSTVDLPLAELIDGDYVIDLHLAANQLGTLIVCGDIEGTPANAAGTPVAIGGQVDGDPTATATVAATELPVPTATVAPTALPTTAPTEQPVPTATLAPTLEPTVAPAPTQEPTAAPASTPDDTADAIGGVISDITGGDGTQGSASMLDLDSGKGDALASNGGVGGGASTGDGTAGGSTTQSGKGGPIASTTTGTLAATGTGSSLLLPQTPYEAAITASGVFSVILFGAAMLLRRGETRAAASRWRRLGL